MENIYMSRGASKVVNTCMKVQPGEQILIVTELSRLSIAQALATEVYRVGAEPAICIMEPRKQDSEEPPKEIAAAMQASDGFLSVVGKSITHTHAVKSAIAAGSRGLVLTHFTEEMMVHGGIEADFEEAEAGVHRPWPRAWPGRRRSCSPPPAAPTWSTPPRAAGATTCTAWWSPDSSPLCPPSRPTSLPWKAPPTASSWPTAPSPTSASACWRNRSP